MARSNAARDRASRPAADAAPDPKPAPPLAGVRAARTAAPTPMTPAAAIPQPEMAVRPAARSIVLRMKRRLSIARAWSWGGSVGSSKRGRGAGAGTVAG